MKGTVRAESDRPIPLERLIMPPMDPRDRMEPFEGGVVMPYDVRSPEQRGNYLEAVTVLGACDDGERIFVRFHRSGSTAWIDTERLEDRR